MRKVLFFFIIFSVSSFADLEERRNKILKLIDSEIEEISRLVKQTRGTNPDLILQLSELYFEQARLIHEKELDRFKNLSAQEKESINKNAFYGESQKLYRKAQEAGQFLLKRYPRYAKKGEVYNILAKNSMEFQDSGAAKTFLKKAYSTAGENAELKEKVGLSIADNFYNEKKYAQAIPLYEKGISSKKDKWWTKDAYNLAWCYYRTHQYPRAINLMLEIHKVSKQDGYVNLAPQVERDLAFFYTSAGRINEFIAFCQEFRLDIPSKLLEVSKFLNEQGKYLEAEKTLSQALNNNPTPEQEVDIYAALLDGYEKYGFIQKHLNACKRMAELQKRGKISPETLETLVNQAQRVSANLQRQVAEKTYEKNLETRRNKGRMAIEYFKVLLDVDPKNSEKWYLATAETLRSIGSYEEAIPFYFAANKAASDKGDNTIANVSVNGLMVALDNPSISKATKDRYTINAYNLSLKGDSTSEKALKIYQRSFSYYMSKGMVADAERVLMDFKKNFPNSTSIQEGMIAKIIDYHKNNKNGAEVERWAKRIAAGEFNVSSEYNKQVRLQFVSSKLDKATNKAQALDSYLEIYNNDITPRGSKVSAAYNISTIYYEIGDPDKTFQWASLALSMMNPNELIPYATSYQTMGKDFLGRRQFDRATTIYEKLLNGICSQKSEIKEELFIEMVYLEISQKNFQRSHDKIERFKQCGIPESTINSLRGELLGDMVRSEEMGLFDNYLSDYSRNPNSAPYLIKPLGDLKNNYLKNGLLDKADRTKSQIYETYQKGLKFKVKFTAEANNIYASLELENLKREVQRMAGISLSFPENVFQRSFQEKFNSMETIIRLAGRIASLGSGQATITANRYLAFAYRNFAKAVEGVVPTGKPQGYIDSFKKTMSAYTTPFTQKASDIENRARKIINESDVLSRDNFYFLGKSIGDMVIEYEYPRGGIPMDRSGSL